MALALICWAPSLARAHSLSADARQVGDRILVEAFFSDNTPAREARVQILDDAKKVLVSAMTDGKGKCSLAAPNPGKYRLVVDAGAGHRHQQELFIVGTLPPDKDTPLHDSHVNEPLTSKPNDVESPSVAARRAELTRFPWERIVIGCGVIGLLGGAWWLSRQIASKNERTA